MKYYILVIFIIGLLAGFIEGFSKNNCDSGTFELLHQIQKCAANAGKKNSPAAAQKLFKKCVEFNTSMLCEEK